MSTRSSDPLTRFSHRLTQIKFIVLEIAMLLVFLYVLFKVVTGELGIH